MLVYYQLIENTKMQKQISSLTYSILKSKDIDREFKIQLARELGILEQTDTEYGEVIHLKEDNSGEVIIL